MQTPRQDPRTIITPDAFSVDTRLLGTPLAPPGRRAVALLIDLTLVTIITALTSGFWFILGVVVAAFFFTRVRRGSTADRIPTRFRAFMGCMGVTVLLATVAVFFGLRFLEEIEREPGFRASLTGDSVDVRLDGGLEGLISDIAREAQNATEPPEVPDSTQAASAVTEALALAADTIEELQSRLRRAQRARDRAEAELRETQEGRGVFGWMADRVDSVGFGLGWWTMYFAILMPRMKGQTPGKRAMGVRVVRLDGQPVTWWHAFERAGGYAAGLATGTLGFAQIYWDPNRQAIHDKIAGTVVILDGAPKVPGRWDLTAKGPAATATVPGTPDTTETTNTADNPGDA